MSLDVADRLTIFNFGQINMSSSDSESESTSDESFVGLSAKKKNPKVDNGAPVFLEPLNHTIVPIPTSAEYQSVMRVLDFKELSDARRRYNKALARIQRRYGQQAVADLPVLGEDTASSFPSTPQQQKMPSQSGIPKSSASTPLPDDDDDDGLTLEERKWPNGNIRFLVMPGDQWTCGRPHVGYALAHSSTDTNKHGQETRKFFCLGVYACTNPDCGFVRRPAETCIKWMPEAHFEEFKKNKWFDKPVKDFLGNLSQ